MKKLLFLFYFTCCLILVNAQETMYIMKKDSIVGQHLVKDIDSLVFYTPPIVPVKVSNLTLSINTLTVSIGDVINLSTYLTVSPTGATDKSVTWSSNNPAVTITNASTGTAVAGNVAGTATITATATDGSGVVSNALTINVTETSPNKYYTGTIPNAKYFGRWEKKPIGGKQYDVSYYFGTHIKVRFTGKNVSLEVPTWDSGFQFSIKIDDGPWVDKSSSGSSTNTIVLASNLASDGPHDLTIVAGKSTGGFTEPGIKSANLILDPGATTLPPNVSNKHIEFIGDSISTVYYAQPTPITHWTFLMGERLNVGHSYIALPSWDTSGVSGIYYNTYKSGTGAWDFSLYTPDVVVVNLGQNGIAGESAYRGMLDKVRAKFPKAKILAIALFQYPLTETRNLLIKSVVDSMRTTDTNVFFVSETARILDGSTGDTLHPTIAGCKVIADTLDGIIASHLGQTDPTP